MINPGSNLPFGKLFSPFSNFKSHHIRNVFIFKKMKDIINDEIDENKVSGRVGVNKCVTWLLRC